MYRKCRVPNCNRAAGSKWAAYCTYHRNRSRRHGHPTQPTITTRDLTPYTTLIRDLRDRNHNNPLWSFLTQSWTSLVDDSRQVMASFNRRTTPVSMDRVRAAEAILRLDREATPPDIANRCMALVMLQEERSGLFRSDDGFLFQLARKAIRVVPLAPGRSYHHESGSVRRVYRDLPKRTMRLIGQKLLRAFGTPALMILQERNRQRNELETRNQQIADAVMDLNIAQ